MFRDALSQMVLVEYMDIDCQAYRPAVLFLNGKYWGIHNIREKVNEHYVAGNFGVDPDEVNLLEGNGSVVAGTNAGYTAMVNYANTHNMADPAQYEVVKAQIDIDEYIDYMIGHIYLAERDWPGNNIKFWRANSGPRRGGDGSTTTWINASCRGWVGEDMIEKTTTTTGPGWPNPESSTRLFRNLLKNESFRNEFIQRYAYHMNTTFDPQRLLGFIDQFQERLAPEIPRHITKWGGKKDPDALETWMSPTFNSVARWEQNVNEMRFFAVQRPASDHTPFSRPLWIERDFPDQPQSACPGFRRASNQWQAAPRRIRGDLLQRYPHRRTRDTQVGVYLFALGSSSPLWSPRRDIVPAGSVWRYSDIGVDLGTEWQQTGYDDAAWPSGPAQLGYGDGDEATVIGYGGDASNKHITTYFRKSFRADRCRTFPFVVDFSAGG